MPINLLRTGDQTSVGKPVNLLQQRTANTQPDVAKESAEQSLQDADILKNAIGIDSETVDAGIIGVGRGLTRFGRGVKQLFSKNEENKRLQQVEREEKQIFDAGAGDTTAGAVGEFAGEILPTLAIPGAALGRGASLASKALSGSAVGAGTGGLQFVDEGQTRGENIAQGAAFGGLGTAAAEGLLRGGSKVVNTLRGNLKEGAQEGLELGNRFGVDVLAPDVARSPIQQKVGVLAEQIPFVGLEKSRLNQASQARVAAEKLVSRLAPEVDDVGREIQNSLTRRTQSLQRQASKKYDDLARASDPAGAVPLANTRAAAAKILDAERASIDPDTAVLERIDRFANLTNAQNFSTARQFRSQLNDMVRDLNAKQDFKAARPLKDISAAIDDDISDFANDQGGDVLQKWRAADSFFKTRVVPQRERDIVKSAADLNPDEIYSRFVKTGRSDRTQRLYRSLDAKGRNSLKAGILQNALERSQQSGVTGVTFSPAQFAQQLEKFSEAAGVVFNKTDKADLDAFSKLMRHIQRAGQVAENPPTGNRLTLPVVTDALFTGGAITGGSLPAAALANVLFTTGPGKRLLLASSKFEPGSERLQRAINAFERRLPILIGSQVDDEG